MFELKKTAAGYSAPVTLANIGTTLGFQPGGTLTVDAAGNLFGTAVTGGSKGKGTVFEVPKTASGYSDIPVVLATFDGSNGANPQAGLISDAAGDLFGTTSGGGANNDGAVFELVKTATG